MDMDRHLPAAGKASSYSDFFLYKPTSSGEIYTHTGLTAAIMPRERWYMVPLGTKVRLTYMGNTVEVTINDRGAGDKDSDKSMERVLDLSRAAMSKLVGWTLVSDHDAIRAGVITLDSIAEI